MIGMESMNVEGTTEENVNNLYNLISKLSYFQTRTTIVVSNGRYTFYQTQFIKYHFSNNIYPITFIKYH